VIRTKVRHGRSVYTAHVHDKDGGHVVDVWRDTEWLGQWRWSPGFTERLSGRKLLTHEVRGKLEPLLRITENPT
jgi:hypothetical protein